MSFFPIDPFPAEPPNLTTSVPSTPASLTSNLAAQQVIDIPRTGHIVREMLTWRTPHLGYVKMYINPQQIQIEESKDITSTRTKGGFVVQYAGENITQISIDGTTGSGGIEGINILESVYRSEQEAFEGIATALDERLSVLQMDTLTGLSSFIDPNLFQLADDALRNFGRPQPTLASLATNIELFFQGVLYRGYFTKFGVSEVAESPGLFRYTLMFNAYAKQGVRRNFMPWHRQPINPADTADTHANPFSFPDIDELPRRSDTLPPVGSRGNPASSLFPNLLDPTTQRTHRSRSTDTATGFDGLNLTKRDLRS